MFERWNEASFGLDFWPLMGRLKRDPGMKRSDELKAYDLGPSSPLSKYQPFTFRGHAVQLNARPCSSQSL